MSAAEVLRYIASEGKPRTRRFRVEGSRVGNSMLLTKEAAVRDQLNYGGKVVEVVTVDAIFIEMARSLPRCKRESCKAEKDQPCRDGRGNIIRPHRNRFGEEEPARELHPSTKNPCPAPECGAPAGTPCKGKNGKNCAPHKARRDLIEGGTR